MNICDENLAIAKYFCHIEINQHNYIGTERKFSHYDPPNPTVHNFYNELQKSLKIKLQNTFTIT